MKSILGIIALSTSFFWSGTSYSAEQGTADEAVAMVQKSIAYMKENGREKTIADINKKGQFVDRDLYVVIYDMKGKNIAHAGNARMIGKELYENKDIDGKFFVKERIELAKSKGKGWQDYKFTNPAKNNVIEQKSMYIEKFEDLIFGCGIYKQ